MASDIQTPLSPLAPLPPMDMSTHGAIRIQRSFSEDNINLYIESTPTNNSPLQHVIDEEGSNDEYTNDDTVMQRTQSFTDTRSTRRANNVNKLSVNQLRSELLKSKSSHRKLRRKYKDERRKRESLINKSADQFEDLINETSDEVREEYEHKLMEEHKLRLQKEMELQELQKRLFAMEQKLISVTNVNGNNHNDQNNLIPSTALKTSQSTPALPNNSTTLKTFNSDYDHKRQDTPITPYKPLSVSNTPIISPMNGNDASYQSPFTMAAHAMSPPPPTYLHKRNVSDEGVSVSHHSSADQSVLNNIASLHLKVNLDDDPNIKLMERMSPSVDSIKNFSFIQASQKELHLRTIHSSKEDGEDPNDEINKSPSMKSPQHQKQANYKSAVTDDHENKSRDTEDESEYEDDEDEDEEDDEQNKRHGHELSSDSSYTDDDSESDSPTPPPPPRPTKKKHSKKRKKNSKTKGKQEQSFWDKIKEQSIWDGFLKCITPSVCENVQ